MFVLYATRILNAINFCLLFRFLTATIKRHSISIV